MIALQGWLWGVGVGMIRCDMADAGVGPGTKTHLDTDMTRVALMEIWALEREGARYPVCYVWDLYPAYL